MLKHGAQVRSVVRTRTVHVVCGPTACSSVLTCSSTALTVHRGESRLTAEGDLVYCGLAGIDGRSGIPGDCPAPGRLQFIHTRLLIIFS